VLDRVFSSCAGPITTGPSASCTAIDALASCISSKANQCVAAGCVSFTSAQVGMGSCDGCDSTPVYNYTIQCLPDRGFNAFCETDCGCPPVPTNTPTQTPTPTHTAADTATSTATPEPTSSSACTNGLVETMCDDYQVDAGGGPGVEKCCVPADSIDPNTGKSSKCCACGCTGGPRGQCACRAVDPENPDSWPKPLPATCCLENGQPNAVCGANCISSGQGFCCPGYGCQPIPTCGGPPNPGGDDQPPPNGGGGGQGIPGGNSQCPLCPPQAAAWLCDTGNVACTGSCCAQRNFFGACISYHCYKAGDGSCAPPSDCV
jgi:hypothetical protein